jgi:hypothetical protein
MEVCSGPHLALNYSPTAVRASAPLLNWTWQFFLVDINNFRSPGFGIKTRLSYQRDRTLTWRQRIN